MAQAVADWDAETLAMRARLAQLTKGRSRTDIARLTGTSLTNVSRYLNDTRMPAEFCAALVKGLDVNPSWLLTGEGTPFVSDITASTASMGGNLLELVEAMNAVSQMRLGALTGKHHLRVLRELNDALTTYERLRAKLNAHSVPIFSQLLLDLRKALDRFQTDAAREMLKAAEQVSRLCDDVGLKGELLSAQAHYYFLLGDHARALESQRQLLLQPLSKGLIADDSAAQTALRIVLTLRTLNLLDEALRVCKAALTLMPPQAQGWDARAMLMFMKGRLMADLGDLTMGLGIMMREIPGEQDRTMPPMRLWLTSHLMRAGLLRPQDALEFGEHIGPKAIVIHDFACWREDPALLKQACDYALSKRFEKLGDMARPGYYGPFLLRALAKKDRAAPVDFEAARGTCTEEFRDYPEVYLAQLWRVLGNREAALEQFRAAQKRFDALPKDRYIEIMTRAMHFRNAQWLARNVGGKELAAAASQARSFFKRHVKRGFRCFRGEVEGFTNDGARRA